MSDEEKKAIEGLEWSQQQMRLGNLPDYDQGHYADIRIVLNLIEKQQKEIEELKEKNRQGKMRIVQLENEITARIEDVNQYYTPNDKIKAKIEEYEKEIQIRKNVINNDVLDKQTIEKARIEWACMEDFIYEMQSLLEKE